MKCSESWLREWVNPSLTRDQLSEILTMAGLEVEDCTPVAQEFSGVVAAQILKINKHPDADNLNICEVDSGKEKLQIVCGAKNVREGMKVPLALPDAILPDKTVIRKSEIRNVTSWGMLCSARELGFAEESDGLMELSPSAPLGQKLQEFLKLDDYVIDVSITPNRGDCLSIKGMSREIAALTGSPILKKESPSEIKSTNKASLPVDVQDKKNCPVYIGRVIESVNAQAETPVWMTESLRRSGVRSISPVVDVTNFVMIELGQPMHVFDLSKISKGILVRTSRSGEKIALLDGSEQEMNAETLVIADHEKALAIAGVMGGLESSVVETTTDIFLESAFFTPEIVARQRQFYNLSSESAYRLERGVDPAIQKQAIERATQLILEIAGGNPGPVIEAISQTELPTVKTIVLNRDKVSRVLGLVIPDADIDKIFKALQFTVKTENNQWKVTVPSWRFDISLPEDLIEEIARLYGYDKIPVHPLSAELQTPYIAKSAEDYSPLRNTLCDLAYHEIISYSFIDKKLQALLDPEVNACELVNPITNDMTLMRTNLWPGLVNTLIYNKSRQQHRLRLFEFGVCFAKQGEAITQESRLGGLLAGPVHPDQWGIASRNADFFDLKGDVEHLLLSNNKHSQLEFKPENHPALHPGQTAGIYLNGKKIGVLGGLHPEVLRSLDLNTQVFVFELSISSAIDANLIDFTEISKFPEIRRDLAILVNQAIPAREIQDTIKEVAGDWLKDVFIFDVYQGKGISPGLKSIALGLILQHPTRTLVDDEVNALLERIVSTLKGKLGAELRR